MRTIILLLLCLGAAVFAQETVRTPKGRLVKPAPDTVGTATKYYTPFLTAAVTFSDSSGDNVLDANETATIKLSLKNIGRMTAKQCEVSCFSTPMNYHITIGGLGAIPAIMPGQDTTIVLTLRADESIDSGQVQFTLRVNEQEGFDLTPDKIMIIPTRQFQPPKLAIANYTIDDQNRNGKIEKFEKVDVTIAIQNQGKTIARGVMAHITLGENVLALDTLHSYDLGDLKYGEYKTIVPIIATNARATEVKLDVQASEGTGRFGASRTINLPFDQVVRSDNNIIVVPKSGETEPLPSVVLDELDIAKDIPVTATRRENAVAVIIGNRDYTDAPPVDYAINDVKIMKNYVRDALGYQEENILYRENAKQSDLVDIFGNETKYQGRLYDYVKKGLSEVFIYYSGHGAPDPETKQGYLLPVDCDPNRVSLNGYPLQTLYRNLDQIAAGKKLQHVFVVLDACFSGNSVKGSLIKSVSQVNLIVEKQQMTCPDACILTSAMGDQVSTWYDAKKQSMFTYVFLRGLKGEADLNKDNIITTHELYQYTADEVNGVPYLARRYSNGRSQTPTFSGKDLPVIDLNDIVKKDSR